MSNFLRIEVEIERNQDTHSQYTYRAEHSRIDVQRSLRSKFSRHAPIINQNVNVAGRLPASRERAQKQETPRDLPAYQQTQLRPKGRKRTQEKHFKEVDNIR